MKKLLTLVLVILVLTPFINVFAQNDKTPDNEWIQKYYHIKRGDFRFNSVRFAFYGIKYGETKSDTLKYYYNGAQETTITFKDVPDCAVVTPIPAVISPNQEGALVVSYNTIEKGEYGPTWDMMKMIPGNSSKDQIAIILNPNILEDFSGLSEEEIANAPILLFENEKYVFDTVKMGDKVKHEFVFINQGKSDLVIRKTKSSCGCTATNPEKNILKSGEASKINIVFNTGGRTGKQNKHITVISNDPNKSKTTLVVTGYVKP